MLRLWGSQLSVALAPDKVVAVQMTRGWRKRVEKKAVWACKPLVSDRYPWEAAVRAMSAGLADFKVQGAPTRLVLSNHFVRYVLVPWADQVTGDQERQVMARINFETHFGSVSNQWDIRLSPGDYGRATLASGIDGALPGALQQACAEAQLNLISLQPYWMTVVNGYRSKLSAGSLCVVVVETGRVGLLMAKGGEWYAVRSLPIRDSLAQDLQPLIRRELLLAGLPTPVRIYLHAPAEPGLTVPSATDFQTEILGVPTQPGFSPRADAVYGMAMGGAR